jgi:asparagine synthase (glutamine-hydrolysing)
VVVQRYWRLEYESKFGESEEELSEEMLRLLREAVRIRLESEVPLGAFLSGGVDSSAVVALAAEAMQTPLNTFSVGFDSQQHDESRYARLVASRFGTNHHELIAEAAAPDLVDDIVWHYDQPFGDSSAIASFQVAHLTRPHVTVVLNGDGGDESFAGYDRYQLSRLAGYFRLPIRLRTPLQRVARHAGPLMGRGQRLVRGNVRDPFEAYFATLVHVHPDTRSDLYSSELMSQVADEQLAPLKYMRAHPHGALLDSMLDADLNNALPDDLLVKMDVATMANSLEGRSPFLDHKLIEFMARVPADLKLRGGENKYLLKSALRKVLPNEILGRRKVGFGVPLGRWLRGSMREALVDTVLSDKALSRGYFKPESVREMVRTLIAGSDRFQYQLWDLLVLERWHQMFIDQVPLSRHHSMAGEGR